MLEAIQDSALSQWLVSDRWVITANSKQILETLHFIAFALQIGAVMAVSLRLLGFGRNVAVAALAARRSGRPGSGSPQSSSPARCSSPRSRRRFSIGRRSEPSSRCWPSRSRLSSGCTRTFGAERAPGTPARRFPARRKSWPRLSLALVADRHRGRAPHVCVRADGEPLEAGHVVLGEPDVR